MCLGSQYVWGASMFGEPVCLGSQYVWGVGVSGGLVWLGCPMPIPAFEFPPNLLDANLYTGILNNNNCPARHYGV